MYILGSWSVFASFEDNSKVHREQGQRQRQASKQVNSTLFFHVEELSKEAGKAKVQDGK